MSVSFSGFGFYTLLDRETTDITETASVCEVTISSPLDSDYSYAINFSNDFYSTKFIGNSASVLDDPNIYAFNNNVKYYFTAFEDLGILYLYVNANGNTTNGNQFDFAAILELDDAKSSKSKILSKIKIVKKSNAIQAKIAALKKKLKK